jgi:hypothetical protein
MRFPRLATQGVMIGVVGLLVALSLPDDRVEGAPSGVGSSAKLLKLAKKANKRSRQALRLARQARRIATRSRGLAGPKGDQGPPGPGAMHGRASASADQALLISWPEMGLEVRTHDAGAGDSIAELRIVNTNSAAGRQFRVVIGAGSTVVGPGGSIAFGGIGGVDALVVENGGAGRMVKLGCFANVVAAGEDGFMQCMAIRAGGA